MFSPTFEYITSQIKNPLVVSLEEIVPPENYNEEPKVMEKKTPNSKGKQLKSKKRKTQDKSEEEKTEKEEKRQSKKHKANI